MKKDLTLGHLLQQLWRLPHLPRPKGAPDAHSLAPQLQTLLPPAPRTRGLVALLTANPETTPSSSEPSQPFALLSLTKLTWSLAVSVQGPWGWGRSRVGSREAERLRVPQVHPQAQLLALG